MYKILNNTIEMDDYALQKLKYAKGIQYLWYKIWGNTSQNGTPSPSSPVDVVGCGERTRNLFDKDNFTFGTDTVIVYTPLYVGSGTFTLSTNFPDFETKDVFFLAGRASSGASSATNGVDEYTSRSVTAVDGYVTVATRYNPIRQNPANYNYMLNTGSTALPYEPYGYKIPIVCDNETKTIYLEEPLHKIGDYADILSYQDHNVVRKIKKLVLTGNESFNKADSTIETGTAVFSIRYDAIGMEDIIDYDRHMPDIPYPMFYSTHFVMKTNTSLDTPYTAIKNGEIGGNSAARNTYNRYVIFASNQYTTVETFKAYLQQQYSAGTPVTVWYILNTPETDEISAVDIQANTYTSITVGTEVQPSQVDFTTKGGHVPQPSTISATKRNIANRQKRIEEDNLRKEELLKEIAKNEKQLDFEEEPTELDTKREQTESTIEEETKKELGKLSIEDNA